MKESGENYLETIYNLFISKGSVKAIDISNALNVSRPSVFRACAVLKDAGLIEQERYGSITLTVSGVKKAEEILAKHKTLTKFFIITLQLSPEQAEYNACRIEHVITDEAMEKIAWFVAKNS